MTRPLAAAFAAALLALPAAAEEAPLRELKVMPAVEIRAGGSLRYEYSAGRSIPDTAAVRLARARVEARPKDVPGLAVKSVLEFIQNPVLLDLTVEYERDSALPGWLRGKALAGQFKTPFGHEHMIADDGLVTINRAAISDQLVPGRDVGTRGRDIGAMLALAASPWGRKDLAVWRGGLFNGEGANTSDRNDQKTFITRLELTPVPFLTGAGSYTGGRRGGGGTRRTVQDRWGWDVVATYGPAQATYEQIYATSDTVRAKGQYVMGSWWLVKDKFQAVVRYDWIDPSLGVQTDRAYTTTFGLLWHPKPIIRFLANYELRREDGVYRDNDVFLFSIQSKF